MSQQSNPATLREALAREIADEFCGGSEAVFEAILAKLAASGTEAAPTITPEILMDAVAMVQDEGLWKFDQPKWYEAMAEALEHLRKPAQAAASPEGEGREQRNWKGVRWADSVKASTLAEEIALHFAHDCNDSMCGEDADASNCEVAWIEDKLTDFLDVQAALRQPAAPARREATCSCSCFAIAALEPERLKSTEYKTGFIDAKNFALELVQRQSAAPSGGEAASMLKEVCEILGVQLGPGLARYAPLIAKVRALALESKTGAVTETK